MEIVDSFSDSLDKQTFLNIFNETQKNITRVRQQRKVKEKLLKATAMGQRIHANKRLKKTQKKKEKRIEAYHKFSR